MTLISFIKRGITLIVLFFLFDYVISIVLLNGLNKYYGLNQDPEVLINGSSMAMNGFNRGEIEQIAKKRIASYTHEGVSIDDRYAMIKHFYSSYPGTAKTVIFEVSPVIFAPHQASKNVYTIFYPFMDVVNIDEYIKKQAPIKDYFVHKFIRTTRFDARTLMMVIRGFLGKYGSFKTNVIDPLTVENYTPENLTTINNDPEKIKVFEKTMGIIESNSANVILVMMPMYKTKLQSFTEISYSDLCNYFKEFSKRNPRVTFLDLNTDSISMNHNYFFDDVHLNVSGQRQVTRIISNFLIDNHGKLSQVNKL